MVERDRFGLAWRRYRRPLQSLLSSQLWRDEKGGYFPSLQCGFWTSWGDQDDLWIYPCQVVRCLEWSEKRVAEDRKRLPGDSWAPPWQTREYSVTSDARRKFLEHECSWLWVAGHCWLKDTKGNGPLGIGWDWKTTERRGFSCKTPLQGSSCQSLESPRRVTMEKNVINKWNLKSCRCSQLWRWQQVKLDILPGFCCGYQDIAWTRIFSGRENPSFLQGIMVFYPFLQPLKLSAIINLCKSLKYASHLGIWHGIENGDNNGMFWVISTLLFNSASKGLFNMNREQNKSNSIRLMTSPPGTAVQGTQWNII